MLQALRGGAKSPIMKVFSSFLPPALRYGASET